MYSLFIVYDYFYFNSTEKKPNHSFRLQIDLFLPFNEKLTSDDFQLLLAAFFPLLNPNCMQQFLFLIYL